MTDKNNQAYEKAIFNTLSQMVKSNDGISIAEISAASRARPTEREMIHFFPDGHTVVKTIQDVDNKYSEKVQEHNWFVVFKGDNEVFSIRQYTRLEYNGERPLITLVFINGQLFNYSVYLLDDARDLYKLVGKTLDDMIESRKNQKKQQNIKEAMDFLKQFEK